jgi:hypothetical protein
MASTCAKVYQIPGPQGPAGADGADGTNGTNGVNAYTLLDGTLTMPGELLNVNATVDDTSWMAIGQIVFVQTLGHMQVVTVLSGTQVTLKNLKDTANDAYMSNAAPATDAPDNSVVSPAGLQGPGGVASSAYLEVANNLSELAATAATARGNLGASDVGEAVFTFATPAADRFVKVLSAAPFAELRTASDFRTDIGLAIGTNVQAYDATLQSLSALGTAGDRYAYTTGVDTWAEGTITSAGRAILDDANAAAQRTTLALQRVPLAAYLFQHQLASGNSAGDFNSGAWQTVPLNTEVVDTAADASIAANIVTLAAGTYRAWWRVCGFQVANFQSRLYNVDTASLIAYGSNASSAAADSVANYSFGEARFTLAVQTQVRLEAWCQTTNAGDGFGVANSFGGTEVYASLELERESG